MTSHNEGTGGAGGRTTVDLIRELQGRADGLTTCALAIGFETTTEFVFASDAPATALATLNAAITRGGQPMGFVGFRQDTPGRGGLLVQPLAEYAEEEWVEKYLLTLVGQVKGAIQNPPAP